MENSLIAMAGLPASGKSALAVRLHEALDGLLLDKDKVIAFLFQQHVDYTDEQNDLCMDVIYRTARYALAKDNAPVVVIDGRSYSRNYQIDALKRVATEGGCRLFIVECVCSAASARTRLEQDQGVHLAEDRNYAMYLRSREAADPITEPRLTLDTDSMNADECAARALSYLRGGA